MNKNSKWGGEGNTHTMKSAKGTLKVRSTLDSLLENMSINGTV